MDLEELEKLVNEYLDTLGTERDYHWEGCTASERDMAHTFLLRDSILLTSGFLPWLKARSLSKTDP